MKLNAKEFGAMQGGVKEFIHKHLEMRVLRKLGLHIAGNNILEIGCGSGFGAELINAYHPSNYLGIDLMPQQIELAKRRNVKNSQFELLDATQIDKLSSSGLFPHQVEEIVVFRILHHIPEWKKVLKESYEKLPPGGSIYIIEPYRFLSKLADLFLAWQHPKEALFSTAEFEQEMRQLGFQIESISIGYGFAMRGTITKPVE